MGTSDKYLTRKVEALTTFEIVELILMLDGELQRRENDERQEQDDERLSSYEEYEDAFSIG